MGSDRARISFDKTRQYRSVVAQQGRVTLEADVNEEAVIASEALRYETIDIIGPTGTPDNGYLVSVDATGDLSVGAGIMYVGGWRMRFPEAVEIDKQPEWIDQPLQNWGRTRRSFYVIALLVSEQEVQAVEDQALREVALGGPDTAARTRLMQHIVAVLTRDQTCAAVLKDWDSVLKPLGLALHPDTFALDFNAALEVSFYPPAGPADPCCPPAQGGYLGADNQLIRVTVTSYDPKAHTGTLLWGWNNSSFLYRATLVDPTATPQILTLSPAPVDSAHMPQTNQTIEVLHSTMVLGDPADLNFIAAPEGEVVTLASAGTVFEPTTNQLTLPSTSATLTADANPFFVRLWQAEIPFTDGTPVQLDNTSGLAVTIHITALPTGPLEARPFWDFAVRPNTPQQVYPQRYLEAPQGPTGPRRWLTDLAIVESTGGDPTTGKPGGFTIVADCRVPFTPITGLGDDGGGCCGITLDPEGVIARGGLQAVVDAQARKGQSLSLRPGRYVLEAPLALTKAHNGFSLSGCSSGRAILSADTAALGAFPSGMITIADASNIVLQGLRFNMPLVPTSLASSPIGVAQSQYTTFASIGIGIEHAQAITIEDCLFLYPSTPDAPNSLTIYIGAGIRASGNCAGLRVLRDTFRCLSGGTYTANLFNALFGVWMTPASPTDSNTNLTKAKSSTTASKSAQLKAATAQVQNKTANKTQTPTPPSTASKARPEVSLLNADASSRFVNLPNVIDQLDDVGIIDNRFTGLTIAVYVLAELGMVRCNNNRVADCCGGFWFLDSDMGSNVAFAQAALAVERGARQNTDVASAATVRQFMQPVFLANALAFSAAVPVLSPTTSPTLPSISDESRTVLVADYTARGAAAFTAFATNVAGGPTPDPEASATPPAATRSKKKAASLAAAPADTLSNADYANASAAYTALQNVGIAKEVAGSTLVPALSIRDNDVELVPYDTTGDNPISLAGIRCMFGLNTESGALFISGNRVEVPNVYSLAATSEWAARTVICGNLFNQIGADSKGVKPCAIFITAERDLAAITGNIVNALWKVTPARSNIPADTDWRFLNTVVD
jgi:hypothetical protein